MCTRVQNPVCAHIYAFLRGPPCTWLRVHVTWCTASNILPHQPSLTLMYSQMSLCMVDCMIYWWRYNGVAGVMNLLRVWCTGLCWRERSKYYDWDGNDYRDDDDVEILPPHLQMRVELSRRGGGDKKEEEMKSAVGGDGGRGSREEGRMESNYSPPLSHTLMLLTSRHCWGGDSVSADDTYEGDANTAYEVYYYLRCMEPQGVLAVRGGHGCWPTSSRRKRRIHFVRPESIIMSPKWRGWEEGGERKMEGQNRTDGEQRTKGKKHQIVGTVT